MSTHDTTTSIRALGPWEAVSTTASSGIRVSSGSDADGTVVSQRSDGAIPLRTHSAQTRSDDGTTVPPDGTVRPAKLLRIVLDVPGS
jgi:hypothetical protein